MGPLFKRNDSPFESMYVLMYGFKLFPNLSKLNRESYLKQY